MLRIYVDIETVPGPNQPSLEEVAALAPKTMKKADTIQAWAEENADTEYRKQALDSMQGEILAIGYAFEGAEPVCLIRGEGLPTEADLLAVFEQSVESHMAKCGNMRPVWIGHNVRTFDLPWLWRKALKYRLHDLARRIPRGRYDKDVEDTLEMWAADYKDRVGLAKVAAFLGLEGKTEGMDGSKVFDAWQAGEADKIGLYCMNDVALVRGVYQVMIGGQA